MECATRAQAIGLANPYLMIWEGVNATSTDNLLWSLPPEKGRGELSHDSSPKQKNITKII